MTDKEQDPVQPDRVYDPGEVPDAGEITDAALTPAADALSLKDRLRQSSATQKVTTEIQGIKRGPGRPRGSRNKPKDGDTGGDKGADLADLERQRKLRKQRMDAVSSQITGELTDALFELMIAQGIPPAAIYNEGKAPVHVRKDEKYTPLGAKLAVDSFTAGRVAAFVVDLESSDAGAKIVNKATNNTAALVIKGAVAVACVIGYMNGVRQVVKEYAPYMEAYKQYQRQQSQQRSQAQQEGTTPNGLV